MAYEVYSFKTLSDQVSVEYISSLLKDGMDQHLEDQQRLEDKVKKQNIFTAKFNKTHRKLEIPTVQYHGKTNKKLL